jgi:hypothetical protein
MASLVRDQMPGLMPDAPEEALQKPPNRGGLAIEYTEAHDTPRAVINDKEAIVTGVTRKARAVWVRGQLHAARSSRIARRSVCG